jgi:gamma-carbonic anhydrase
MKNIISIKNIKPSIGENSFISETSLIIGDVRTGRNCSFWFHSVVRGDVNSIEIGDNVNVQDGAIIHCTYLTAATKIGDNVSIGHNAIVHGCTIHSNVLIGMGAIVMDKAVVEEGSIVAAGAIVLENTLVKKGSIYGGIPAKYLKEVDENQRDAIERTSKNYLKYANWFDSTIQV